MLSLARKGKGDSPGAGKGEQPRGVEKAGLHFTLEKVSPPGNQRLWKDEGGDGVQRGAFPVQEHLLLFSTQAGQWGRDGAVRRRVGGLSPP